MLNPIRKVIHYSNELGVGSLLRSNFDTFDFISIIKV